MNSQNKTRSGALRLAAHKQHQHKAVPLEHRQHQYLI